jgi:CO/xanthine dehydrogenase Mo-binding subunit
VVPLGWEEDALGIGANIPRLDGRNKVTGEARYIDDLAFEGMLHGVTVRSTVPHGRVRSIEMDPAFDWTGIIVADHRDIPGQNVVTLIQLDQPLLAADLVRHVTEPVLLIAAPTRSAAFEAAKHVRIDYEELPAVFTIEESKRLDAVIYGEDNVFKTISIDKGDLDAGFAGADAVVEGTYHTGLAEQMYIEPQGVIAVPGPDRMTIYGSLQCPYYIVKALKPILGYAEERQIQVIQTVTGGGFGGKEEYPNMIAGHAAILARKAGRPVKIVYDRDEDILATTKRHPSIVRHRTGVRRDGTLVAMDVEVALDGGAYATLSEVVLSRGCIHAAGAYRCPNVRIQGRAFATHTPPRGAFRGFGAPQTCFAVERHMDRIARVLGLDPLEMRRRNMLRLGDQTATGQVLRESVGSEVCLESALRESDFVRKRELYARQSRGELRRRGIGLSFFFHGAGFTGNGEQKIKGRSTVDLAADGTVEIRTGSTDIGQGTETIFPQMAATALGVPIEICRSVRVDTLEVPDSGPTVASRTCMVVGQVVYESAKQLGEELSAWIAKLHGLQPSEVSCKDGRFRGPDGKDLGQFREMAARSVAEGGPRSVTRQYKTPDWIQWDDKAYHGDAYPVYSWACDVAEVEVDMETYEVKVTSFVAAQEIGRAINPTMVAGQIEGGSLQAIGYATLEELHEKRGLVENHRMTNCLIPTSLDAPPFTTRILEEPFSGGPFGAKGVGELPCDGGAPAVVAAIEQATGAVFDEIPVTPEKIELALNGGAEA